MGTTTKRGLRYPEATVLANTLHTQIKNLADDTELQMDYTSLANGGGLQRVNNLAQYQESAPNLPGYIVVQTNVVYNNVMTRLHITGWVYEPNNNVIDVVITFYPYDGGGGDIYNYDISNQGSFNFKSIGIYHRNVDSKIAVIFEPTSASSGWQYPKLQLDAVCGHTFLPTSAFNYGEWAIGRVTSLSGYTLKKAFAKGFFGASEDSGAQLMTFENTWSQYGGSGATDWLCRFQRKAGIVYVKGLAAVSAIGAPSQTNIFTLPAGFRPSGTIMFNNADASAGIRHLYIQGSNGWVYVPGGLANASWMNLQCSFQAVPA